jgi:hypothetical protein
MDAVHPAPVDLRRVAAALGPPLAAFLLGRCVIVAASIHAGTGWPGSNDLAQGDAHNYLSIAQHGYSVYYCTTSCPPGLSTGWWGNAGWFPLYPLLIAPFVHLGVNGPQIGSLIAAVCEIAALTVLWVRFARPCGPVVGALVLATAAVFPGAVYLHAVFPLSLLALLALLAIDALRDERWPEAGLLCALAAATYPLGVALGLVGAVWAAFLPGLGRLRRALIVGAPGALVAAAVFVTQRLMTGYWDAFSRSRNFTGHPLVSPLTPLRRAKSETLSFLHDTGRLDLVPSVQTIVVLVFVAGACAGWAISRRREDSLVLGLVLLCWLVPLTVGGINTYRTDVVLLPALLLTRRLPVPVQILLLALVAVPTFLLATLFFEHRLE